MTGLFRSLQVEPAATQHHISGENASCGEKREGAQTIKNTTAEGIAANRHSLNQTAKDQSLHTGRNNRPNTEDDVPLAVLLHLSAKFKGYATQPEGKEHDGEGNIERWHQNAIGDREACQQCNSSHDQPSC